MKKLSISTILALCFAVFADARASSVDFGLETRASYTVGGPFSIDYFAVYANGGIGEKFSYNFYGYPNKLISKSSFFDSLSWGMLSYAPSKNWDLQMGKLMIEYAGIEYDYKPIDIFTASEYWLHFPAFQLGITGQYITDNGDKFSLQITESPFSKHTADNTFYCYSASARGNRDIFGYSASFNILQFAHNRYSAHEVVSGWARLGPVKLELDIINRSDASRIRLFKDYSIVSQAICNLGKGVQLFVRYSKDKNTSGEDYASFVYDGEDVSILTGGLLWRPEAAGGKIRFHLYYTSAFGKESPIQSLVKVGSSALNFGVTWDIKFIKS